MLIFALDFVTYLPHIALMRLFFALALGFFNTRKEKKNDAAFLDIDWITFSK